MLKQIFIGGFRLVHQPSVHSFFEAFTQLGHCVCSLALNKLPHFSHNISNTLRIIYLFKSEIVQIRKKSNLLFHAYKVIFLNEDQVIQKLQIYYSRELYLLTKVQSPDYKRTFYFNDLLNQKMGDNFHGKFN